MSGLSDACEGSALQHALRLLRIVDVTAAEVAARAEISAPYLSQLASGARSPSPAVAKRLAAVLKSSPEKLFPPGRAR
jgi:transcriptional regulator with XRE-family HTH domain